MRHVRWGKGSAASLELAAPYPFIPHYYTSAVSKDTPGDFRGKGIYTLGGPGIILGASLAVCTYLTMSVIPQQNRNRPHP